MEQGNGESHFIVIISPSKWTYDQELATSLREIT